MRRRSSRGQTLRTRQGRDTGNDEQQCNPSYSWRAQDSSRSLLDELAAGLSWRVLLFTTPVPQQIRIKSVTVERRSIFCREILPN